MKRILSLIATMLILVLVGCNSDGSDSGQQKVIKLAHSGSESHQYHIAAEKFKEIPESNEDVNFKVDIHPNASLGSEGDVIEQVMNGSVEMTTVAGDSNLTNTIPEMNVFGIPYLFDTKEEVYNALDGEGGKELLELAEAKNMHGLGYWEVGFRHLTNDKREIINPKDVENMKIRVQPAAVWEEHIKSLGASPTPVDFNELYSALDQGVIDGEENPLPTIDSMKFYEVQKFISLTAHNYTPAVTLLNKSFYDGLDDVEKDAVNQAFEEAKNYQRDVLDDKEDEIITKLEENGVSISEPNRKAFKEATKNVKEAVSKEVSEEIINKLTQK